MKNRKLINLILLTILTLSLSIPFAQGATVELINWETTSGHQHLIETHETSTAYASAYGQCFNATQAGHLIGVSFYLKAIGNPDMMWFTVKLCNTTANGDGLAPGTEIAVSTTFLNGGSIDGVTGEWIEFSFWEDALIYPNTIYALYIYNYGSDGSLANNVEVHYGDAEAGDQALSYWNVYASGAWIHYNPTSTLGLKVSIHDDVTPDSTPGPTTTIAPTSTDELYAQLVDFLVPLLVMILPALLLWWLGGKGKWPLLIGLAIGTSLGYMFITGFPLWLVFLVAIGIIGMAYSDVSSGGSYT